MLLLRNKLLNELEQIVRTQITVMCNKFYLLSDAFSPNDAQLDSLKKIKFVLKLTLQSICIFNVAPCVLPHLLYNPTHALFTL